MAPVFWNFWLFLVYHNIEFMIVILDNIRSLHNVGSIFRTADAAGPVRDSPPHRPFGRASPVRGRGALRTPAASNGASASGVSNGMAVEKIYLCGITPGPIDRFSRFRPQFTKVSLGAEKIVQWEYFKSASRLIDKLKKDGYKIWAVEQHKKSIPYYKVALRQARGKNQNKLVLIFGNEVKGISPAVLKKADKILEIPMRGRKESLNVAVAFGIVIFHLIYGNR